MAFQVGTAWEIRTTGSDLNGGAYGSGGVDYSQTDAKRTGTGTNDSTTDVTTNGTTTVTSASANFTSDLIGNVIYFAGGTGAIAGVRRQVVSVTNATTIVMDISVIATTNGTMNIGGALASIGECSKQTWGTANRAWIKSGTYVTSVNTNNVSNGKVSNNNGTLIAEGYQTTRGDLGTKPILQITAAGGITGVLWNMQPGNGGSGLINIAFDMNGKAVNGCALAGTGQLLEGYGCAASSGGVFGAGIYVNCVSHDNTSQYGFADSTTCFPIGCTAYSNTCTTGCFSCPVAVNCIAYNNTMGNNTAVFNPTGNNTVYMNCIAYNTASAGGSGRGFGLNSGGGHTLINCLAVDCSGIGFQNNNLNNCRFFHCAAYSNGTDQSLGTGTGNQNIGFVTLSAMPFTNAGGLDFTINNTAGGGADLRSAGWPTSLPGITGTGYPDIGAFQHLDAAAGGTHGYAFP